MSEKFQLKWNDFQHSVSQSFRSLREEEDFFDVTLVSDDEKQVQAHKLVLSACSDFFKSILKRNSHSHPLLYLSGVDSKSLGFVLDYIYHGEVQVYQHELDPFLEVVQKLRIEGLLSIEDPDPIELKEVESFITETEESLDSSNEYPEMAVTVIKEEVTRMKIEVDDQVHDLIEKRDGRHYCKSCDYNSQYKSHVKEHAERHIQGLSYSCKFCDKTFRSSHSLRMHNLRHHKTKKEWI